MNLKKRLSQAQLYVLLSNINSRSSVLDTAKLVIEGGADIIQLREKYLSDKDFSIIAQDLRDLTSHTRTILIINDRVQIARTIEADGVHVGQHDMQVNNARGVLGEEKIIGVSTHTLRQAQEAQQIGADYIAIGPIFPTKTKEYEPPRGIGLAREVIEAISFQDPTLKQCDMPIFAIGGITLSNIDQILKTGICRVAISSAIVNSEDVISTTKRFKCKLKGLDL